MLPRTMAFLMEYLRHKIAERMQSNEDLDEFWHNRINRNKEVAKKWCAPTNRAALCTGCVAVLPPCDRGFIRPAERLRGAATQGAHLQPAGEDIWLVEV